MKKIVVLCAILLFSFSCSATDIIKKIDIDNVISDCIKFKKNKIEKIENLLILNTVWEVNNNIGVCGCKSSSLKYDVMLDDGLYISKGIFSTIGKKKYKFVISSDNKIFSSSNYKLIINCN